MPTNTIYKILPVQIPLFWNSIKFACIKADNVKQEGMQVYFNELLQALLSDKAQCFVALNEDKVLASICVTRILVDKFYGNKELLVQCLYSMETISDEDVINYWKFIADFARVAQCKYLVYNTRNPRVWHIAEVLGCAERYRTFEYKV